MPGAWHFRSLTIPLCNGFVRFGSFSTEPRMHCPAGSIIFAGGSLQASFVVASAFLPTHGVRCRLVFSVGVFPGRILARLGRFHSGLGRRRSSLFLHPFDAPRGVCIAPMLRFQLLLQPLHFSRQRRHVHGFPRKRVAHDLRTSPIGPEPRSDRWEGFERDDWERSKGRVDVPKPVRHVRATGGEAEMASVECKALGIVDVGKLAEVEEAVQSMTVLEGSPKEVHRVQMRAEGRQALDVVRSWKAVRCAADVPPQNVALRQESEPMRGAPAQAHAAEVRTVVECECDPKDDVQGFLETLGYVVASASVRRGTVYHLRLSSTQLPVEVFVYRLHKVLDSRNATRIEEFAPNFAVVEALVRCEEGKKMEASPAIAALRDKLAGVVALKKPQEMLR